MKLLSKIVCTFALLFAITRCMAQSSASSGPYCSGSFSGGNCIQGGVPNAPNNFVNDFIDSFSTSGGITNIINNNSGCSTSNNPNNYVNNFCKHYLEVTPGQTITCVMKSGAIFAQGFAVFIDWDQDNVFQVPAERVAATANVPGAASIAVLTFVVPPLQPNGTYRLRVRCAFNTPGTSITPCGSFQHGETEDYGLFIGPIPVNSGIITATVNTNAPVCSGQAVNLGVNSTPSASAGVTYSWTGPNNFSAVSQNPVIANASPLASGIYSMNIGGACPVTKTVDVMVVAYPAYTITPVSPAVCQGDSLSAAVIFSPAGNNSAYSYTWVTSPGASVSSASSNPASILTQTISSLQAFVYYTVTVSSTLLSCPVTKTETLIINNPSQPTLNLPPPLCNTASPFLLSASPGSGTWTAGSGLSSAGSFSPALATNGTSTLTYSITVNNCVVSATGTLSVSQFNTPALSVNPGTLCANDPVINLMSLVQTTVGGTWLGQHVSNNTFLSGGLATGIYSLTYSTQSTPIASVCPAFSVHPFPLYNPPVPVIAPINPVCNNGTNVSLSVSLPGGTWLGAGVSAAGIQSPSLNLIGINTLTYSLGQGTCVATPTKTFHVSQFNTAALTNTFFSMCVTQGPVNLMALPQNTVSGSWSGISVAGTYTFFPFTLPSNTYTLTYLNASTPNPTLCPDTRTLVISLNSPPVPVIAAAGPLCSTGNTLQLSVAPNSGSWTSTSYLDNSGVLTPSLCTPGNNPVRYTIGSATCNIQQSISISVETFVPAKIIGSIPVQCNSNPVFDLHHITLSSNGTWSGPGIGGTLFNPGTVGSGTFVLKHYTATSPSSLCPDQDSLSVKVYSLSTPVINNPGPFCNSSRPVQLQVTPLGGVFSAANDCIDRGGFFKPILGFIGNNIINYTITAGPCFAYAQTTITVEKFVSAGFEKQLMPYCRTGTAVNMNSFVQNPGGAWSGPGISGTMFDPGKATIGNNLIVYKTHSMPTATLCPDIYTVSVLVNDVKNVTVAASLLSSCAPAEISFSSPGINTGKGTWYFDDGSKPAAGLVRSHLFSKPGIYSVLFKYDDSTACLSKSPGLLSVKIYESPLADFSVPEEIPVSEPAVQLQNLSYPIGNNRYTWNIDDRYTLEGVNPIVKFDKAGRYAVTLTATSPNGCRNEITRHITVNNDFNIYIPNAFTPNADGLNDVFTPVFSAYGLDTKNYDMEIFDRWGHSLFHTNDLLKGWDGTAHNSGEAIKEDVYTFMIRFKDLGGNAHLKTGFVTLVK